MNHPDREFSFAKIKDKVDLIAAMFNHKWPLCYGFYHDKLLYLSDGESEDTPEYSVMTIDKTEGRFSIYGREVGRVKPAVMQAAEVARGIQDINYTGGISVRVTAEPKWHHSCRLCRLEEE